LVVSAVARSSGPEGSFLGPSCTPPARRSMWATCRHLWDFWPSRDMDDPELAASPRGGGRVRLHVQAIRAAALRATARRPGGFARPRRGSPVRGTRARAAGRPARPGRG